jgi:hypothetical protein
MNAFLPFSSSSTSLASVPLNDDPHLEVVVLPSASAFYAGEKFSVTITFRNTRPSPTASTSRAPMTPQTVPASFGGASFPLSRKTTSTPGEQTALHRLHQVGLALQPSPELASDSTISTNAQAGPSRTPPAPLILSPDTSVVRDSLYSPGASAPGWPTTEVGGLDEALNNIRSPEGWRRKEYGEVVGRNPGSAQQGGGRRTRSLALGKGGMSPQELVWALGGDTGELAKYVSGTAWENLNCEYTHKSLSILISYRSTSITG